MIDSGHPRPSSVDRSWAAATASANAARRPCRSSSRSAAAVVPAGIYCDTPEHVHRFRRLGATFAFLGAEQAMLRAAALDALSASRA